MNIFAPIVFLILLQIIRDLSLTYGASPSLNPQKMRLDEVWPVICCSGTERTSSPSLSWPRFNKLLWISSLEDKCFKRIACI